MDFKHTIEAAARALEGGDEIAKPFGRGYSGRGMYGRNCVAITGSMRACQKLMATALQLATSEVVEAALDADDDGERQLVSIAEGDLMLLTGAMVDFSTDQFGRDDIVMYWPHMPY